MPPALLAAGATALPASAWEGPHLPPVLLRATSPDAATATPAPVPPAPYARRFAARQAAAGGEAAPPPAAEPPAAPRAAPAPPASGPGGRLLVLLGVGGGAGCTLVAHALADALASVGESVLLLDLDAGGDRAGGDRACGLLGLERPGGGLAALALAGTPGGPGWDHLVDAELRPVGPALRALPGLARPAEAALVTAACVAALLESARHRAAWVVADLGRWSAHPWHRAARLACDEWLLVLPPTGPGVAAARAALRELADEAPGRAGRLVPNRAAGPAAYPAGEVAAALGWPVLAALPDDPAAAAWALARQVPLGRAPRPSPTARDRGRGRARVAPGRA